MITGQGIGAVITGISFGRLSTRFGVRRVMVGALSLGPIALAGYAMSPNAIVAFLPIVGCGLLYFAALSSFNTVANLRAPSEIRGRVLSLNQVALGGVYAISLNVQGQLGDRIGLRTVTFGSAVMCLVVLGLLRVVRPGYSEVLEDLPVAVAV